MLNQIKLFLVTAALVHLTAVKLVLNIVSAAVVALNASLIVLIGKLVRMHDKIVNDAKLHEIMGIPVAKHELIILNREGYIFPKDIAFATMQYVVIGHNIQPKFYETLTEAYNSIR